jgi:hypothetical protein
VRRKFIGVAAMYCLGLLAGSLAPRTAAAQQYLLGGSGELGSGIEGGPPGAPAFSLARLRLRVALDVRVDEFPADIYAVGMLIELTPHSAFGFDVRYARRLGLKFEVNAGGVAYIAPESLFGPSAGLKYRMPLSATTHVTLGPEANVFVIGSDLPSGTIIWQVLVQAGFHADL